MKKKETFFDNGLQFECTGCGGCCITHGDYAYVYLTDRDINAARRHLKMSRIDFLNAYCRTDENGFIHLSMVENRCNFLEAGNRCAVYPARPVQCRTWPFWTENLKKKIWQKEVAPGCPGVGRGRLFSKEEILAIAKERDDWYGIDF